MGCHLLLRERVDAELMHSDLGIVRWVEGVDGCPAASLVLHAPAGHALAVGALAAAKHLSRDAEDFHELGSALDGALAEACDGHDGLDGESAASSGVPVGG